MTQHELVLLTIGGMALATFLTRAGGVWLIGRINPSPRLNRWLSHLPGAVLVALVVPAALEGGGVSVIATLAAVLVAARTRQLLFAVAAGLIVLLALGGISR